jgi:heme/copper-type cytochrome/quinol oxidase subunit 2
MLKYNLEKKLVKKDDDDAGNFTIYCCELCGTKPAAKKATITNIKEFYKDGTTKIHYTCSNHIVDLYNKIEIKNKEEQEKLVNC